MLKFVALSVFIYLSFVFSEDPVPVQ